MTCLEIAAHWIFLFSSDNFDLSSACRFTSLQTSFTDILRVNFDSAPLYSLRLCILDNYQRIIAIETPVENIVRPVRIVILNGWYSAHSRAHSSIYYRRVFLPMHHSIFFSLYLARFTAGAWCIRSKSLTNATLPPPTLKALRCSWFLWIAEYTSRKTLNRARRGVKLGEPPSEDPQRIPIRNSN